MENPYCPIEDRPNAVSATGLAQNVPSSSRRQARRRHTMSGGRCRRLGSVNSGACSRNLPKRSFALAHNISQCPFLAPVAAESAKKVGKERQRERGDSRDGEAGRKEGGRRALRAGPSKEGPSSVPNCDVLQSSPKEEKMEQEKEELTLKCNRGNQEVH